jgi:translocation and assembly module TamB
MSILTENDRKNRLPVMFYIKTLIFLGIIAISAVMLRPVQEALNREMLKIRTSVINKLEDITGTTIRYSSIRPSFLGSIRINNLNFYKKEAPIFKVTQVRIHFSLWELLLRKKTFIHTIDIDRPEINIDTVKDADYIEFISALIKNNKDKAENINSFQITEYLPLNANYQIRRLNFTLTDKQTVYKIQDTNLNIKEKDGEITLSGRFYSEYKNANLFGRTITINTDSGISGVYKPSMDNANAVFSVYEFSCYSQDEFKKTVSFFKPVSNNSVKQKKLFNLHPFKTSLTYNNNIMTIKPEKESENNYNFIYNAETKKIQAGLNLDNFKPESLIKFSNELKDVNDLFLMQITGKSSFVANNGFMNYNINMKGNKSSNVNNSFVIDAYGSEKKIVVNDFYITSENAKKNIFSGSLRVAGDLQYKPLKSNGTIAFNNFSLTGKEVLNAAVNVSSTDDHILISSKDIDIAQTVIKDISISLFPGKKGMEIETACLFAETGAIYLDAVYSGNPEELEASVKLDSLSLFEITEIIRPFSDKIIIPTVSRGVLKKSSINTEIFFSTDFKKIVYNAPNIVFNSGDTNVKLSLSGSDKQIKLSEGIFSRNKDEVVFTSNIDFSNPRDLAFLLNASYNEMTWHVEGQVLDRKTVIIRDPNGFHGYGNISSNGAFSGYIEVDNYPILANSQTVYLNFYSSLRYSSLDFWHLELPRFSARYASAADGKDFLKISGMADQNGASFRQITYADSYGILLGGADFSWDSDFSFVYFDLNITDGNEMGENYNVVGMIKDEGIKFNASVANMRLNRFLYKSNPMLITAKAEMTWDSIKSFNGKINISSLRTTIDGSNLYAEFNGNVSNNELFVFDSKMEYSGIKANVYNLKFNIDEGVVRTKADIRGFFKENEVEGNIGIEANFAGVNSWLDLDQIITDLNGKISLENISFGGDIRNEEFILAFKCKDGAVSAKGGKNDMIRLEMDREGIFFVGLASPMPIRGNIVGTFKKGIIDSSTNNFYIDIVRLYNIFASPKDFAILSGYISGKTQFVGPFWNPEFHGTAKAESLRFKVPNYIKEDIKVAPVDILAEGYEMTFGPAGVLSGSGNGTAKGWFLFENWAPINIGLDISIQRDNPIQYGINIGGFLSDGTASGNINLLLDLPEKLLELKGDLFTNESELGINMEDLKGNAEIESSSELAFNSIVNIKITTGSRVEFTWPAASPIFRAMPEMGTVISVSSDTQAGQYSINSNVKIRSGELYYFDRNFYIRQGSLVLKENETKFDPRISARAEIKDRTDSGNVTISMIIENQSLFSFEPRFEASPSMTQLEIYSILGQNFTIVQTEDNIDDVRRSLISSSTDIATQLVFGSDAFSQLAIGRQFERQVRNLMGLDMFSVRTRFTQNLIVSAAGLSQSSSSSKQVNFGLGNFFDNSSVSVGKYIGQDMFAQSMVKIKYDERSTTLGGVTFEPELGIEFQTPFFNIRWDYFYPELTKNFWVNNSITLMWSKSF